MSEEEEEEVPECPELKRAAFECLVWSGRSERVLTEK